MSEEEEMRVVPQSELDFQSTITIPVWGKQKVITKELKDKLTTESKTTEYKKGDVIFDADGNPQQFATDAKITESKNEWSMLGYLTQDYRLGYLSEAEKVHAYETLDLAFANLHYGCPKAFTMLIAEVAHLIEISHSKDGAFRKGLNTMRTETKQEQINRDEKTSFWGGKK